jgi:hypothetical protein
MTDMAEACPVDASVVNSSRTSVTVLHVPDSL